jgi:uncharacterized membrane protein
MSSAAAADDLAREMEDLYVALIRSDLSEDHQDLLEEVLGEESLTAADGTDRRERHGM